MKLKHIQEVPVLIETGGHKIHESVTRAYQILQVVKTYGRKGTPTDVLLEIIEFLEQGEGKEAYNPETDGMVFQ